jgi:hypothetical protein
LQLKEAIAAAFISLVQHEEESYRVKAQDLVFQVIQVFVSNTYGSQETLKLTSEEGSCKDAYESGSTEKMPETEYVTEILGNNFCACSLFRFYSSFLHYNFGMSFLFIFHINTEDDSVQRKRRRTGPTSSSHHTSHGNTGDTAMGSNVKVVFLFMINRCLLLFCPSQILFLL